MAFLYSFATPRTRPIQFESLGSSGGGLLSAAFNLFNKKPTTTTKSAASTTTTATGKDGSSLPSTEPVNLLDQIQPDSPGHNLALATEARQAMQIALQTNRTVDKEIETKRIPIIQNYLPFIRTIVTQHLECEEEIRKKNEKSGPALEWSTVLITGARPDAHDKVPFNNYSKFDLQQELAHTFFSLALAHYQRAGSLTFHAVQLALTIPASSFLNLLPGFAPKDDSSSSKEPKRKFNPLSYEPPGTVAPKSSEEIARIKTEIIAERKNAVQALRTAAGVFEFLATSYLPSLPIPDTRQGRIPDTMAKVSESLLTLSLVHVQQHTILSSLIATTAPSPILLAKLCQGIVLQTTKAVATLKAGVGSYYGALEQSLHEFLRITIEYYTALRLVYHGVDAEVSGAHGCAITLFTHASELLSKTAAVNLATIRDCNVVISELKLWLTLESTRASDVLLRLRKDNDQIYFEKIPKFDSDDIKTRLATSEEGVFMATPLPYQPPQELHALFIASVPNPARYTSGSSGSTSSGTTTPTRRTSTGGTAGTSPAMDLDGVAINLERH